MLESPSIVQCAQQATAVIHLTIAREQCPQMMGPAIAEVKAALAAQGMLAAGPVFSHHLIMPSAIVDFEIGVPLTEAIRPVGRVEAGQLPATRVARTVYRGGYQGLGAAWAEFNAWIAAQGHRPAASLWECYIVGPGADPAADNWRTELNRPLLD